MLLVWFLLAGLEVMAEGHGLGPGWCQGPGESGRRRGAFKSRFILGKPLTLPAGLFPPLCPAGNEPDVLSGVFWF